MLKRMLLILVLANVLVACQSTSVPPPLPSAGGGQPAVTLNTPATSATQLSGYAYNVDPSIDKIVIYALTNQWYEWRADHVTFTAWNSWGPAPSGDDLIYQWTYTGGYIPPVGQERVHINLWLLNWNVPISGIGNEMVINSFAFQP